MGGVPGVEAGEVGGGVWVGLGVGLEAPGGEDGGAGGERGVAGPEGEQGEEQVDEGVGQPEP